MSTKLPKNFREIASHKITRHGGIHFKIPSVAVDDAAFGDDALSCAVMAGVDDEGTEERNRAEDDSEDSPWWEGKPVNLNIVLEMYIEGGETDVRQTTRYTEQPCERLSPADYTALIQEGVDELADS